MEQKVKINSAFRIISKEEKKITITSLTRLHWSVLPSSNSKIISYGELSTGNNGF